MAVVSRYARRRGITPAKIREYLNPKLHPSRYPLPDAGKASARLLAASQNQERIVIFGDYDADGITSVSILLRFFHECTSLRPDWKLPNRQTDHYDLDLVAAEKMLAEFQPALVICIDNGTNAAESVAWLRSRGVDTIVVDHHPCTTLATTAVAMVNPKAHQATATGDLADLCAAGLALVFCAHLAQAWGCAKRWDYITAIMIAGIGTLADAVPLSAINRAVVKSALQLINTPAARQRCAGLRTLMPDDGQPMTQRRIEFEVVPPLNALGRLAAADPGVLLLTRDDITEAESIATRCRELNESRKTIQQTIVAQGVEQGRKLLEKHPALPVLVLAHPDWLPGVVGPAASRIAEQFERSAILLGLDHAPGKWKGSGRSFQADNLGAWLLTVKQQGLVERAGGHAAAAGLSVRTEQICQLRTAARDLPMPQVYSYEPAYEVIGKLSELRANEWMQVIEALSPFGSGNPMPAIAIPDAVLCQEPVKLKANGANEPWAWKADFTVGKQTISVIWREVEKAAQWRKDCRYDLELELTTKRFQGRTFINWSVVRCAPPAA